MAATRPAQHMGHLSPEGRFSEALIARDFRGARRIARDEKVPLERQLSKARSAIERVVTNNDIVYRSIRVDENFTLRDALKLAIRVKRNNLHVRRMRRLGERIASNLDSLVCGV